MELEADKGKLPHFPEEMEEILAICFPGEIDPEVRQVHSSALLMHALIYSFHAA